MSDFYKSTEAGREHLRRALDALPAHEPAATIWPRIAAQLKAKEAIVQALPSLPTHEPDAALWAAIASRLDVNSTAAAPAAPASAVVVRPLWPARPWQLVASIAAALLLVLGAWWLGAALPPAPSEPAVAAAPHETMTSGEEEVGAPVRLVVAPDPLAQQGEAFIDAHCVSLPNVCQSSEFRALRAQLTEVEAQQQRLQQDARRFGASPMVIRQQGQLTTLRATLTRELVQLLIS